MKCLLLTDRANWAYHSIAKSLVKYNTDQDVKLSIMHIKGREKDIKKKYKKFDRVLVMGWQNHERIKFIDPSISLVGIHSHHGWDDRKTTPEKDVKPPKKLLKFLNRFRAVNVVSQRLYNLFRKHGVENISYTPNGVDTEMFTYADKENKHFTVGYSGSKAHDWRKGVSKFILPAAKKARAKVKIAMLSSDKYIPLEDMPSFYRLIDCYICASSSEGFSLSVLEAASCGCPIISTRVGGTDELIRHGENGFLVNREVGDIAKHISMLKKDRQLLDKMGRQMRQYVVDNYGWNKTTAAWIEFLKR